MSERRPLNQKERLAVLCSVFALGLVAFMAYFVPTGPYKKYVQTERDLKQAKLDLQLALDMKVEAEQNLLRQEQLMERLNARPQNFELWAFMNKLLRETDLMERANLQNQRPSSRMFENPDSISMVELRLNGVTLEEVVSLLHRIYDSKNVVVLYKLDPLRTTAKGQGLECNMVWISPKV